MWLVFNLTNYGWGIYFGGYYRTKKEAQARLKYIKEHGDWDEMCDSWRIYYVPSNVPIDSDEFDV